MLQQDPANPLLNPNPPQHCLQTKKRKIVAGTAVVTSLALVATILAIECTRRGPGVNPVASRSTTPSGSAEHSASSSLLGTLSHSHTVNDASKSIVYTLSTSHSRVFSTSGTASSQKTATQDTSTPDHSDSTSVSSTTSKSRRSNTIKESHSDTVEMTDTHQVTATVTIGPAQVMVTVSATGAAAAVLPEPVEIFNGPISCDNEAALSEAIMRVLPTSFGFSVDECEALFNNVTEACEASGPCFEPTVDFVGNMTAAVNITNNNAQYPGTFLALIQAGCKLENTGASASNQARFLAQRAQQHESHARQQSFRTQMRK